jgi:hypothetical protein
MDFGPAEQGHTPGVITDMDYGIWKNGSFILFYFSFDVSYFSCCDGLLTTVCLSANSVTYT